MKAFKAVWAWWAVAGIVMTPGAARAQLYGDEGKSATKGDLNNQDYWWTKFDMMMLDIAMKQHQPQGRISVDLASTTQRLDALAKKYPKHEGIKQWQATVKDVSGKLDPNAPRSANFGPDCPWDESNFAQLWVNLHWAPMLIEAKDYELANQILGNVESNYEIMLKPDRMKSYPTELRQWVVDNKPTADKLAAQVHAKIYPGEKGPARPVVDKNVQSGDLNSQDYWWSKFDDMMLGIALKQHQPEGRIGLQLAGQITRLNGLMQQYPNDQEIKDMKKRAEDINAKIDPNAPRSKYFSPECPWEESNFAQLWVNLHWAQAAYKAHDYESAEGSLANVERNYDIMLKPDRMKDYPADLRQWVTDNKLAADQLLKQVKGHTHH